MALLTLPEEFIILCWAAFYLYLFISAFSVKRTVEGSRWGGWGWRLPIILVIAVLVIIVRIGSLQVYLGEELWPQTLEVGIVADAVTVIGMAIALWARRALGSNWSASVVFKENHKLIENGPYKYVRHPMYTGILTMFLGAAIFVGLAGAFAVFVIGSAGLLLKAHQEENLMAKHFPKEYPKYKARTKMIIPFLI